MAETLTDFDVDILTLVLLALPVGARQREWIYVALACRALHAAVLRAAEADHAECLRAAGLPGGHPKRPLCTLRPSGKRFATSLSGAWVSPTRIVFTKEHLAPYDAIVAHLFSGTFVPPRLRAQFLRMQYDPRQTQQAREAAEARAAHHLSTRALHHLLQHAPLHTIQACFFDVLGAHDACVLHLSLRHHRALVFFAATHGRVDVLDRLVHRNPQRARAYDFDVGLLQLLKDERLCAMFVRGKSVGAPVSRLVPSNAPQASREQLQRLSEIQLLIARPAALNDRVNVLRWLSSTLVALDLRINNGSGGPHIAGCEHATNQMACFSFAGLCVRDRPWWKGRETCEAHWHAFRLLLCEAAAGGSLGVLDALWTALLSMTGWTARSSALEAASSAAERAPPNRCIFQAGLMWGVLLHLMLNPRRGAVVRWLANTCHRDAKTLKAFAIATHACAAERTIRGGWHPDTFDAEDLLAVGLLEDGKYVLQQQVIMALGIVDDSNGNVDHAFGLRDSMSSAGDPSKMDWLLDEFANANAHNLFSEDVVFPSSVEAGTGVFCAKTGCGWFARSLVEASKYGGLVNMLRHDLDPTRWTAWDSVCCYALRGCCHIARTGHTARPGPPMLLHHGRGTTAKSAGSCFAAEAENEMLPESFVFWPRCATLGNWMPTQNFAGVSLMGESVALVLRRWLMRTLEDSAFDERIRANAEKGASPPLQELFNDWMGALNTEPEACYGSLEHVCDAFGLSMREAPHDTICRRTRERRSVLGRVVLQQVFALIETATTMACPLASHKLVLGNCQTPESMLTLAVAYAKLGTDNGLFQESGINSLLAETGNANQPDFTYAMCMALGRPMTVRL